MFEKKSLAKRSLELLSRLRQMTSKLDRMLDEPLAIFRRPKAARIRTPKVDVVTKDNTVITRVDLPGMTKDDVLVRVEDGQVVLSGERPRELEEDKNNVSCEEPEFGSFRGVVHLPEDVKAEDVTATFANGVLEVSVVLPDMDRAASNGFKVLIKDAATPAKAA